jgi:hypothetical protein
MRSRFGDSTGDQEGSTHEAMPDHERDGRPLLLGERQELRRKAAHGIAVERYIIRDPKTVENRKQSSGSSSGSPSASACSISKRARSAAAFVSGAA